MNQSRVFKQVKPTKTLLKEEDDIEFMNTFSFMALSWIEQNQEIKKLKKEISELKLKIQNG